MIFPLIFLDFDGVLNSIASQVVYRTCNKFDSVCVGLVQKLAEDTSAQVVISSSWRVGNTLDGLREHLAKNGGPELAKRVVAMTPRLVTPRGTEIKKYLDDSGHGGGYVILDDDGDMLDGQPFIRVDRRFGFSLLNYHAALMMLNPYCRDAIELKAYAAANYFEHIQ